MGREKETEVLDKPSQLFTDDTRCKDFDGDCEGLRHAHCWAYDPSQGWCPYLRATDPTT